METTNSQKALLAQVARGLLRHSEDQTKKSLGNRQNYIGMSDVGKGVECLRSAVAAKLSDGSSNDIAEMFCKGEWDQVYANLQRQLILQRGHWLETGIEAAFQANQVSLISQLEIALQEENVPIRAHLDFTVVRGGARPAVRVLELKSTEKIPNTLYPAYEAQINGQVGLLSQLWAKPAFSLKNNEGKFTHRNLTFPEIVKTILNIDLPAVAKQVDIQGWVLCLSMADGQAFGPYLPDRTMLGLCKKTARAIWETAQAVRGGTMELNAVSICSGFHPLCDWCSHAADCPKFSAQPIHDPALEDGLKRFNDLKAHRKQIDDNITEMENRIRKFCHRSGSDTHWYKTDQFRFKNAAVAGRKNLDRSLLENLLSETVGEDAACQILERATVQGSPYERLYVNSI